MAMVTTTGSWSLSGASSWALLVRCAAATKLSAPAHAASAQSAVPARAVAKQKAPNPKSSNIQVFRLVTWMFKRQPQCVIGQAGAYGYNASLSFFERELNEQTRRAEAKRNSAG